MSRSKLKAKDMAVPSRTQTSSASNQPSQISRFFHANMLKRSNTAGVISPTISQNNPNLQVHKLPLKCVRSVDSLVEALQQLTEKPGGFKIEMRHNSYIITSRQELKTKDILARIASQEDISSPQGPALLRTRQGMEGHGHASDLRLEQGPTLSKGNTAAISSKSL
ncbi:hypothetical protein F5144DRAFT_560081 [Chaetomium tenue]|uniref:Uncharacterized protein n=1 Tax=Chaetomium tenue TaxID=1854479 RepID=A0ACB7PFK9_9PEZI|nr:hypothetical protein F5144DRAFT_560081 [Chaetomium globosum]